MKRTATIILSRNLPKVTDALYESLTQYDGDVSDIFVVESGSLKENLSQYCTWWANWEESMEHGLRFPRGFNFALSKLFEEGKFKKYDYFFFVCNDTEFSKKPTIAPLVAEMDAHPRLGILSPCSNLWGEKSLLGENDTKYFWYVHMVAWMMKREYIEDIMETEAPNYMNFLYDGTNFRGYESNMELVIKGYANDWATAITTKVRAEENESHLKTKADLIRTEQFEENLSKVEQEGKKWLRRKYGFNNRWTMQIVSKFFYEKFFEFYPEFDQYKI